MVLYLYKITEIINDTIPACKTDNLAGRYNESSLKKTELTLKENKDGMKKIKITYFKSKCLLPSLLIEINLFVDSNAYPFISFGTTPSNLNSTLIGWEFVKFF